MQIGSFSASPVDVQTHYLWDNWICRFGRDRRLHRFSLAAPRTLAARDRHDHAAIHHWTSPGPGHEWRYRGVAVARGGDRDFDSRAIWSGCCVDLGDRLVLFYTGVSNGASRKQSISTASSVDGRRFTKLGRTVLEPGADRGYDDRDDDGIVMAWRDPFVFRHPATGAWHMVFAAKRARWEPRGCLGHAVALDETLERWRLLAPLDLPASYTQMECPSVVFCDDADGGSFYCFASTKDREARCERRANIAIRVWRARRLDGPWQPAGDGGTDLVLDYTHRVYGASLLPVPERRNRFLATAFFSRHHGQAFSWAPLVPVDWQNGWKATLRLLGRPAAH